MFHKYTVYLFCQRFPCLYTDLAFAHASVFIFFLHFFSLRHIRSKPINVRVPPCVSGGEWLIHFTIFVFTLCFFFFATTSKKMQNGRNTVIQSSVSLFFLSFLSKIIVIYVEMRNIRAVPL